MFTRQKHILGSLIAFFVLSVFIFPKGLLAAPYYEGKTIKIIVGAYAGGGYDRTARILAKHLPKYIPGKPTIVVEAMPGASGMIQANSFYNSIKADGLTIGAANRGLAFAQLLKADGVRFDFTKYSWIGSAAVESYLFWVRSDLPYKTFEDLRRAKGPIPVAGESAGSADYQFASLLKEFVGINLKIVMYPAGSEGTLAVERKEVDGRASSYSSAKPLIERGLVRPMIRGRISEPEIENLPVDEDLTTNPIGKTIMAMRSAVDGIGRPFIAPPGTPADLMNILRDAFANVAKDPELKEDSKKLRMRIEYTPANECLKVLNFLFNQPPHIVNEFSKYIKF